MIPKPFPKPIYVTRPFLPPLADFQEGLAEIWNNAWLTNNGPILERYRKALVAELATENLCLFNNGTLALQIAIQGMGLSGEVITTPFTFVATTHALFWNKIRPVFVDIEPDHYTLDPDRVEAAITPWTTAILAVHVYGHPCKIARLEEIARKHKIALLFDAAHAFGVRIQGQPITEAGDLSMFSFHATKLYHSLEGGMLTFRNPALRRVFDYLKNFGFENEVEVVMPGTNAKMNEVQALMGLQVLAHLPDIIQKRRLITERYRERLADVPGIVLPQPLAANVEFNYAYMPVEVDSAEFGLSRDALYSRLKEFNVHTRRYFYPLVCDFACYRSLAPGDSLPVARRVAERILTLPIYSDLPLEDVDRICDIIAFLAADRPARARTASAVAAHA